MFNLLNCIILKIVALFWEIIHYFLWQNYSKDHILSLNFSSYRPISWCLLSTPKNIKRKLKQGRSQRESGAGAGGLEPPQSETHPPWAPNEMTLSTGVYGEPPVWVPVSPPLPHPPPPWRPLILKRLATPQLMRQLKTSLSLNKDIRVTII